MATQVKGIVSIKVNDAVRVEVEAMALQLCKEREVKPSQFNQDLNATVAFRWAKKCAADTTDEGIIKCLQGFKVLGNSSALRQAISEEKKVQSVAQLIENISGLT